MVDLISPSMQDTLRWISRLESLTVHHHNRLRLDWSNNSIHPALLCLLHLPTLIHLKVTSVNNFIISDLIPCVNLKYLDIGLHMTGAPENSSFAWVLKPTKWTLSYKFYRHYIAMITFLRKIYLINSSLQECTLTSLKFAQNSKVVVIHKLQSHVRWWLVT